MTQGTIRALAVPQPELDTTEPKPLIWAVLSGQEPPGIVDAIAVREKIATSIASAIRRDHRPEDLSAADLTVEVVASDWNDHPACEITINLNGDWPELPAIQRSKAFKDAIGRLLRDAILSLRPKPGGRDVRVIVVEVNCSSSTADSSSPPIGQIRHLGHEHSTSWFVACFTLGVCLALALFLVGRLLPDPPPGQNTPTQTSVVRPGEPARASVIRLDELDRLLSTLAVNHARVLSSVPKSPDTSLQKCAAECMAATSEPRLSDCCKDAKTAGR